MVPCAAQGWYSVFVNETKPASVLFRAYIRRKPSGLLLVTVLSTLLPRPVFRSYPLDIGEAVAVERSVGHALETLHQRTPDKCEQRDKSRFNAVLASQNEAAENYSDKPNRKSHSLLPAVNIVAAESLHSALPCGPEDEHCHADKREEQHASEGHGEFKQLGGRKEFQHGSPHGLHQPCTDAAVRSDQQESADGYAVNDGHLVPRVKDGGENATCGAKQLNRFSSHAERTKCEPCESTAPYNLPLGTPDKSPEPTQHLRLRVVWQGLLT